MGEYVNNIWFYILLGLIQGTVEWLPISSEGMLTVAQTSAGVDYLVAIRIAIWLHIGTLGAVMIVFREEWRRIFLVWDEHVPERKFVILTTIGTGIVGIPVKVFLVDLIGESATVVGWIYIQIGAALLVTAVLLRYSRFKEGDEKKIDDLPSWQQLLIGFAQGFTIIPGISRSGTTVSALLFSRVDGEESFRGSFLMSVPAVAGGVFLDIIGILGDGGDLTSGLNFSLVALGIVVAFISGLATIKLLLNFARKLNFALVALSFGVLLILVGLFLLLIPPL